MPKRREVWLGRLLLWLAERRTWSLVMMLGLLIPLGIVGYVAMGGLSVLDALYQTMITLTTVGYTDLTTTPMGRVFSIIFMTIGVGVFVVTLSAVAAVFIEGRLRQVLGRHAMDRKIDELRDHLIVCGFGRFGQLTCEELMRQEAPFVLIDSDPKKVAWAQDRGMLVLEADATEESALTRAGLARARGVISTLSTDAANVYVALTTKGIRRDIPVVTLARDVKAEPKLRAAGADYVVSPYNIGAASMASRILRPHLTQFVDQFRGSASSGKIQVQMEELPVRAGSPLVGRSLRETPLRREFNLIVVAIVKAREGDVQYSPGPDLVLEAGDVLVCVGPPEGLARAVERCATHHA